MTAFRILLTTLWVILTAVTVIAMVNHGPNLFSVFFGDIRELTWRGQFNVDFSCYLIFSALWLMWRHQFAPIGYVLGVFGFFGGAFFLIIYLLIVSFKTEGDMAELFLGTDRAQTLRGGQPSS